MANKELKFGEDLIIVEYAKKDRLGNQIDTTYAKKTELPTVNNGTLTIQRNGTNVVTFTANQSGNSTANISVPTRVTDLSDYTNYIPYDGVLMPTNSFGGKKLYINSINDSFWAADAHYYVTATKHKRVENGVEYPYINSSKTATDDDYYVDGPVISTYASNLIHNLFDGSYETTMTCAADEYMRIRIMYGSNTSPSQSTSYAPGYVYGIYYISYYYTATSLKNSQCRTYCKYAAHGLGWKTYNFTDYIGNKNTSAYVECSPHIYDTSRTCTEFIIFGDGSNTSKYTGCAAIECKLDRPNNSVDSPVINKYGPQDLYYATRWYNPSDKSLVATIDPVSKSVSAVSFTENGTSLANKYLGKSAQAADSAKLNGQAASYYQAASTAVTHTASTAVGGTTTPVYIAADGKATALSYTIAKSVPSDAKFTDTTYESKAAASGGSDVSLVTTGEKYTWNNKGTYSKPSGGIPASDLAEKYVRYDAAQSSLTDAQKTQARTNIGAGTSSFTGYTSSNKLSTDYINNVAGWTSNTGTVTSVAVKMNGATKGTVTSSGEIDLGTVITSHQSLSNYVTLDGTQTISGSKTFSSAPIITSTNEMGATTEATVYGDGIKVKKGSDYYSLVYPGKNGTFALLSDIQGETDSYTPVAGIDGTKTINGNLMLGIGSEYTGNTRYLRMVSDGVYNMGNAIVTNASTNYGGQINFSYNTLTIMNGSHPSSSPGDLYFKQNQNSTSYYYKFGKNGGSTDGQAATIATEAYVSNYVSNAVGVVLTSEV